MRVTLADLARRLGLSKSTVSRALRGDPRVTAATRERVLQLAAEYNYSPHPLASALARNRSNTLGVAIPFPPRSFSNPFYLEFVGGVGDCAMTKGYTLFFLDATLFESPDLGAGEEAAGGKSGARMAALADGFILTEPLVDDPRIDTLLEMKKPFVLLGSLSGDDARSERVWCVDGDNVGGCRAVVGHLIALGHRRIACITGSPEQAATERRLLGYRQALESAGLPFVERAVVEGDFTEEGGRRAVDRLLAQYPEATAIFASNDLMAIGAIQRLSELSIEVPGKMSVAGFDGIRYGRYVTPELTTAVQPIGELGRRAATTLLALVEGEAAPTRRTILPCTLRPGASAAAPPEQQPE